MPRVQHGEDVVPANIDDSDAAAHDSPDSRVHRLDQLPPELVCLIVTRLVPSIGAPSSSWRDALALTMVAHGALLAVCSALAERLPEELPGVAALECDQGSDTAWLQLLSSVRSPDCGVWTRMKTLRAVRPATDTCTPLATPPRLSGASLTEVDGRLVLFGGRKSETGETVDALHVVITTWFPTALAQWDVCRAAPDPQHGRPTARCYHSGTRWCSAAVLIFGGAGDGNVLHDSTWVLRLSPPSWQLLDAASGPSARSAHACAASADGVTTVMHGGLGNSGTCSDAWRLGATGGWRRIETSGAEVARAHHCGGMVGATFVVYSGQDANLLTVESVCTLNLGTGVWATVGISHVTPRIDAAAATLDGCGLVVFGGVGVDFEFEPPIPWLLPASAALGEAAAEAPPPLAARSLTSPWATAPQPRACASMCSAADGLQVFVFAGFDGESDLDDLWQLSLVPACFRRRPPGARPMGRLDRRSSGDAEQWRARQAAQAAVCAQTWRDRTGQSYVPLHLRVWQAGEELAGKQRASSP